MKLHHFYILVFHRSNKLISHLACEESLAYTRCAFKNDILLRLQQTDYLLKPFFADERLVWVRTEIVLLKRLFFIFIVILVFMLLKRVFRIHPPIEEIHVFLKT